MQKRAICFLLSVFVLFGMVCATAPSVSAASEMKTSEAGIALMKLFEGFSEKPYFDYSQWSVGYGTACNEGDYPNGITEAEADALMRKYIEKFETRLNSFIDKYSLSLSQHQFDALISFTYNLGSSWMNDSTLVFTGAVINGTTGDDFMFAIARWCNVTVGGKKVVEEGLVKRRLIEGKLYLTGDYTRSLPTDYKYVIFDDNIEESVNDTRVQAYNCTMTAELKSTPTKSGYRFLGWYTSPEGGEWVSSVGPATTVKTLYGHWQAGDGERDESDVPVGTPAEYQRYCANTTVRKTPSLKGAAVRLLEENTTVTIVADFMDEHNIKWGKLSDGGWICLADTAEDQIKIMEPVTVRVIGDNVNNRVGPGTDFEKQGVFVNGQELVITAVQKGGIYLWGKCAEGWICLSYTNFDQVTSGGEVIATGIVTGTDKVNVRGGAGTDYPIVGSLHEGDRVTITQQKKVANGTWGLTELGWVSMYYIKVIDGTQPFDDVHETDWFRQPVLDLYNAGLVNGVSENPPLYGPEQSTNRGMMITMIWRMMGSPEPAGTCKFTDVAAGSYYGKAVTWGAENGVVNGVSDSQYAPDASITREQFATMLYRLYGSPAVSTDLAAFPDSGSISGFAQSALAWAVGAGILNGKPDAAGVNHLLPQDQATRAETAAMLQRYMKLVGKLQ